MRARIGESLTTAIKARDARRTSTLRLVTSAIKDRDIELRGQGKGPAGDDEIIAVLQKMVKQREESVGVYAAAGRKDLAEAEQAEIAILGEFLPSTLGPDELEAAIGEAIRATGATGAKDMGKVIAELRARYPGRIDFGRASGQVKAALTPT